MGARRHLRRGWGKPKKAPHKDKKTPPWIDKHCCSYMQWCSRKYLGTGAVENISMVLFL